MQVSAFLALGLVHTVAAQSAPILTTMDAPMLTSMRPSILACLAGSLQDGQGGVEVIMNNRVIFMPMRSGSINPQYSCNFQGGKLSTEYNDDIRFTTPDFMEMTLTTHSQTVSYQANGNRVSFAIRSLPRASCKVHGCDNDTNNWIVADNGSSTCLFDFELKDPTSSKNCFCDDACTQFTDCCADYQSTCLTMKPASPLIPLPIIEVIPTSVPEPSLPTSVPEPTNGGFPTSVPEPTNGGFPTSGSEPCFVQQGLPMCPFGQEIIVVTNPNGCQSYECGLEIICDIGPMPECPIGSYATTGNWPPPACNKWMCVPEGIAIGRPYLNEDGSVALSDLVSNNSSAWCTTPKQQQQQQQQQPTRRPTAPRANAEVVVTQAQAKQLADEWAKSGLGEHASVASFARFSLALMGVGAPPALLLDSNRAANDEIAHAQLCFNLAVHYQHLAGDKSPPVAPGPFPLEDAVLSRGSLKANLQHLATATAREGCVHETVAAIRASTRLETTTEPQAIEALTAIWTDEARHAGLAWRTIQWALAQPESEGLAADLEAVFAKELKIVSAAIPEVSLHMPAHGFVGSAQQQQVAQETVRVMLAPWAAALLTGRPVPQPLCKGSVGRAVCAIYDNAQFA